MLYGEFEYIALIGPDVVLILIFLENALRPNVDGKLMSGSKVLILIFLENALRLPPNVFTGSLVYGLNPYFFGKCSTAT